MNSSLETNEKSGGRSREPETVVYVDPDPTRRDDIELALSSTRPVRTAPTLDAADESLASVCDCVVVASSDCDGIVERITGSWAGWPVIVVSETRDRDFLEAVAQTGAVDIVFRSADDSVADLQETLEQWTQDAVADIGETVLDIAGTLMSAAPDEVDTKIEWSLRSVATRLNADACVLYRVEGDLAPTHSWVRGESLEFEQTIDPDSFPGFETLSAFESYCVPSVDGPAGASAMPNMSVSSVSPDARSRGTETRSRPAFLEQRKLKSFLAVPVVVDWELFGVVALARRSGRGWPKPVRQQVKRLGELVGHTLRRERRRKELEHQNDRLEQFASVVSHDLRNPINVIDGHVELARQTGELSHLEHVSEATDRMETMLEDLLTLARDGRSLGALETTDLGVLARDTWDGVKTGEATLVVSNPGRLEADPSRLRQVFENVFRNATEHAGSDVTVRVVGTETGFAIEDDGPGVEPEKRSRVFEEGYTGGNGTGLGLAIVETVVEAHDWAITLTDGDDGGARFEIDVDP